MILDQKDIFKKKHRCDAIRKRYGKDVTMNIYYDVDGEFKSCDDLKAQMLDVVSLTNNRYKLTEFFKNGLTDYVTLEYNSNGKIIKNKFSRFIDAEITMIDRISDE